MEQEKNIINKRKKTGWKEILTLILGIISMPPGTIDSFFYAIVSIILGFLSKKENNGKIHVLVKIGWTISIISIIMSILFQGTLMSSQMETP